MSEAAPRARTQPRLLEVQASRRLSPNLQRITLGGAQLAGFPDRRAGAHIKLFLPQSHQAAPILPRLGPDGPIWPPADECPITRTYSVRAFDPAAGTLTVDFVRHGDNGPASAWARRARLGDRIGLAGPGGPDPMVEPADWTLFAGDLSALPAIAALLETLPDDARGHAIIEVPHHDDRLALIHPPGVTIDWLVDTGKHSRLVETVTALQWPQTGRPFAWIAGENKAVIALRQYLRSECGLQRGALYTVPYWKNRANEETYHAERHDVMDAMEID